MQQLVSGSRNWILGFFNSRQIFMVILNVPSYKNKRAKTDRRRQQNR